MPLTTLRGALLHELGRRTSPNRDIRRRGHPRRVAQSVLLVAPDGRIVDANMAAESFFEISAQFLQRQSLKELVPFGSPLLALIDQGPRKRLGGHEYKVDSARRGWEAIVWSIFTLHSKR